MIAVILVIHIMVAVALVALVMLQRSEGGALGIGGGGGFMTGRGTANLLTRATAFVAAAFFATSIILTLLARGGGEPTSIINAPIGQQGQGTGTSLPPLQPATPQQPAAPQVSAVQGLPSSQPDATQPPAQQISSVPQAGARTHFIPAQLAVSHGPATQVSGEHPSYSHPKPPTQTPPLPPPRFGPNRLVPRLCGAWTVWPMMTRSPTSSPLSTTVF